MAMEIKLDKDYYEGKKIAAKARDQKIETGKVTIRCPKCNSIPTTIIEGTHYEYVSVKCPCGYVRMTERGI